MKKGEVIDFKILRIQNALDEYSKKQSIPTLILRKEYSLDDMFKLYNKLSPKHKELANKLKENYRDVSANTARKIKKDLNKDYHTLMRTLATTHESFVFPEISEKYRQSINPVKALYYEVREVKRTYNPENMHHLWVIDVVSDPAYKEILLDALRRDISRLEKIIAKYYSAITAICNKVPLELFHARQTLSDFKDCVKLFSTFDPRVIKF